MDVSFDPTDVPRDQFIIAGSAWQMARGGLIDAQQCGIFEWHGWWFIWGNVVREPLSFNKFELLPWDVIPGSMTHNLEDPLPEGEELAFYDGIANLTCAGDYAFDTCERSIKVIPVSRFLTRSSPDSPDRSEFYVQ